VRVAMALVGQILTQVSTSISDAEQLPHMTTPR
jgi:hypothetical protein